MNSYERIRKTNDAKFNLDIAIILTIAAFTFAVLGIIAVLNHINTEDIVSYSWLCFWSGWTGFWGAIALVKCVPRMFKYYGGYYILEHWEDKCD